MRQIVRHLIMVTAALLALTVVARADVTTVTASPGSLRINPTGVNVLHIRWRVGVTTSILPDTVSSSVGQFYDGATLLASPGGLLSRPVGTAGASTLQFTETITVGRSLARTLQSGATVYYRRAFTDGGTTVQADLAISVTQGGQVAWRDVTLRFDDDSTYQVVPTGAVLGAEALVTLSGGGVIDAVWEVAKLTSAAPNSFRPLRRVRRASGGAGRLVLESPALPTLTPGIYALRLVPSGAQASAAAIFPTIRYAVVSGDAGLGQVRLTMPDAGASYGAATRFGWTPEPGAASYRIEFLRGDTRVAGIAVAAPATQTRLKAFTLQKAKSGGATHWRALAFDADGRLIAASPLRRLSSGTDQSNGR